jgi:hypothetical protein
MPLSKKILILLFGIILFISGTIRFLQSANFDFPFTYDQARDMLDIRVLAHFYDFKISGPTTSITGLNLGPFYYIFSLPAYWIGGGSPQVLVYWNILWFLISAVIILYFFWKRNVYLGFFISIIYLMSPQLFSVTRYFWNANSVVYFITFYLLAMWNFVEKKSPKSALILGVTAGLVIQFEAAFGSMCVVFSFLFILLNRKKVFIKNYLVGVLPWFIPQIIFEIIHKFQMTKLLIGTLTGTHAILGPKMSLGEAASMHWRTISTFFEGQFMLPFGVGLILLVTASFVALQSKSYKSITLKLLAFLGFAFLYYTVIYHHELKPWYLEGIRVWYCFIIGIAIVSVTKYKKLFFAFVALFLVRSFYLTISDQSSYITDNGKSNDPKNATNFITSINWVYKKANGEGFEAYNYVPEIHDYSPQYMYWWYGNKQFGYTPAKVSYSTTEVPEYIRMESRFKDSAVPNTGSKIALMYEISGNYEAWLDQFKDYCVVDKVEFSWHVNVEWRENCAKKMSPVI